MLSEDTESNIFIYKRINKTKTFKLEENNQQYNIYNLLLYDQHYSNIGLTKLKIIT